MTREQAVARLESQLRRACATRDEVVGPLVCALEAFGMPSSLPLMEEAFELGIIDTSMTTLDFVHECLEKGDAHFQEELANCQPTGIEDALEELSEWGYFQEPDDLEWENEDDEEMDRWTEIWNELLTNQLVSEEPSELSFPDPIPHEDSLGTIRNQVPRVGRNEPCPCGSGRKYKRCCGRSASANL